MSHSSEAPCTALSGSNLFLAANSQTKTHLSGRIVPQSGADLANLGVLFSKFLAGENQTLVTKGDSVQPAGSSGPVAWLSDAFKTLTLDVILPGQKFDVSYRLDSCIFELYQTYIPGHPIHRLERLECHYEDS